MTWQVQNFLKYFTNSKTNTIPAVSHLEAGVYNIVAGSSRIEQ